MLHLRVLWIMKQKVKNYLENKQINKPRMKNEIAERMAKQYYLEMDESAI